MAAYAGIDVAWVRIFWIVSGLFTGGFTCLVYLVMIFAVPVASSSEELAAAHGAPFNAQEVIDRAQHEDGRFAETSSAKLAPRRTPLAPIVASTAAHIGMPDGVRAQLKPRRRPLNLSATSNACSPVSLPSSSRSSPQLC